MFFYLILLSSQTNNIICICNNECHPFCKSDFYNASSSNSSDVIFRDYLSSKIKDEQDIELNFYSKHKGFNFQITSSYFGKSQVTLNILPDSEPIKFKIKQNLHLFSKTLELKPNYKVILPDLTPIPIKIRHNKINILEDSLPATVFPVSVSISKMETEGSAICELYSAGTNPNPQYNLNYNFSTINLNCEKDNLASESAYKCGLRCWGSDTNYTYTFKGVRFGLYGTLSKGNHYFTVELDNEFYAEVNEYQETREEYKLVYLSPVLEYREHKVKISAKNSETYEFHKLVFWPSMTAKRLNFTSSNLYGNWFSYSDGVGGKKYRLNSDGTGKISLNCSKFWIYGTGEFQLKYNNKTETVAIPEKGLLLYESPELDRFNFELSFTAGHASTISCLYYEDPPIPISVGVLQMDFDNIKSCGYYIEEGTVDPTTISSVQDVKCDKSYNLNIPRSYSCGLRCWGNSSNYAYTFKGVKFAIYGTYDPGHDKFAVELDGKRIATVDEHSQTRINFTVVYESDLLEYGEHHVKIASIGQMHEIYKLVYWPSLRARRVNSSSFTLQDKDNWQLESDGIGGYRLFKENNCNSFITIACSKFWFYGLKDPNHHNGQSITIEYDNTRETINFANLPKRVEGALIYESPDFPYSTKIISITATKWLFISCIYVEEPLIPSITPIPISIGLPQMNYTNVNDCGIYGKDNYQITEYTQNLECNINDLNVPTAYQCGLRCWGDSMTYEYTFKGVKFAVYGKFSDEYGKIKIKIDDAIDVEVNVNKFANFQYALIYESITFPYGNHKVYIYSDANKYELYKLVFWPSLKVKRLNSTDFAKTERWDKQSDGIGGVREYTFVTAEIKTFTFTKSFYSSRIWYYSSTMDWAENFTLTYLDVNREIAPRTAVRQDSVLLEESKEYRFQPITLHGETKGDAVLYCTYYTIEPAKSEYINKVFSRVLPYFDIYVPSNSITDEISGCTFNNIQENFEYIVKLEKEVLFYDNAFKYDSPNSKRAAPIVITYNGKLTIKNCRFENANCRTSGNGNVFHCHYYTINVVFESCQFINCGISSRNSIIEIRSESSNLNIHDCDFTFSNAGVSSKSIRSYSYNTNIHNCKFTRTGPLVLGTKQSTKLLLDDPSNVISVTQCVFDDCKVRYIEEACGACCARIELAQSSFNFESNIIQNMNTLDDSSNCIAYFDCNYLIQELEFKNITFANNKCSSSYGGGSGINIKDSQCVTFTDCKFTHNEARRGNIILSLHRTNFSEPYYNGDGGGFQIGFECNMNEAAVKINGCIFKDNKAFRHGGAISIQTLSTVEITGCTFTRNEANVNFADGSELLFENHFHKKKEGRGGAIYINPAYTYSFDYGVACYDLSSYMTDVLIEGCQFMGNSAYDGFAMYIEGDDPGTKFDVRDNYFANNDSNNQNDQLSNKRGDIASEIESFPEKVKYDNSFSDSNHKRLVYVDHYGKERQTKIFSQSEAFTQSNAFSYSKRFSKSEEFTTSELFSRSNAFSYSKQFSKSKEFTTSELFSVFEDSSEYLNPTQLLKTSNSIEASETFESNSMQSSESTELSITTEISKFEKSSQLTQTESEESFEYQNSFSSMPFESIKSSEFDDAAESTESLISIEASETESIQVDSFSFESSHSSQFVSNSETTKTISFYYSQLKITDENSMTSFIPSFLAKNPSKRNKENNLGLIIGIVLGIIVVLALIIIIVVFIIRKKSKNKSSNEDINDEKTKSFNANSEKTNDKNIEDTDSDIDFWL